MIPIETLDTSTSQEMTLLIFEEYQEKNRFILKVLFKIQI